MSPAGDDLEAEAVAAARPSVTIGAAVDHLLNVRGLQATAVLADVLDCWEEAVGSDVASHVVPVALRQNELVVEVDEPAWATQVQLLSSLVVARLVDQLGPGAPDSLRVRVARPGTRPNGAANR